MKTQLLTFLVICIFFMCPCKDKNETQPQNTVPSETKIQIKFACYWNNELFQIQQPYTDQFGTIFRIDFMKQYVSYLQLQRPDGSYALLRDFDLIDFTSPTTRTFSIPAGSYNRLELSLGVPKNYNIGQDPAQYPNDHPLSVAGSQGMFWHWNTGYIFSKFEGKCDTTGISGNSLIVPIAIHAGTDSAFRSIHNDSDILITSGQIKNIEIKFHIDRLLNGSGNVPLNLEEDAITHSSTDPALARLYMDNLAACIEFVE